MKSRWYAGRKNRPEVRRIYEICQRILQSDFTRYYDYNIFLSISKELYDKIKAGNKKYKQVMYFVRHSPRMIECRKQIFKKSIEYSRAMRELVELGASKGTSKKKISNSRGKLVRITREENKLHHKLSQIRQGYLYE
jgi:hypothetical protein